MVFLRKSLVLSALALVFSTFKVYAQEANFSMHHYTPFFTNPGSMGVVEDAGLMLNYRNQAIEVGANFQTFSLSGYYPFYLGNHRLVVAGNFLNDQASDFVKTNGGLLALAYSIQMTANSELSFGVQAGYFQRKMDNNFITDDQFVNGAFDPTSVSGDAVLNQTKSYPTLSTGLFYLVKDNEGRRKAFIGGSIFNATEPNISFIDAADDNLPMSFKATAGYRVYQGNKLSVLPNLRWVNQTATNFVNIGSSFGYELSRSEEGLKKIELGLWYNTNDLGVFSLAFEQPNMIVGVSYDLPVTNELNIAQNGIFELAISFRIKKRSQPYVAKQIATSTMTVVENEKVEEVAEGKPVIVIEEIPEEESEIVLEEEAKVGLPIPSPKEEVSLTHREKEVLSKTVRFQLNSDKLDADSELFLDKVSNILVEKKYLKVELVGHTCNLGTENLNVNLSVKRARQVQAYLVKKGVSQDQFIIKGMGESQPIKNGNTEADRQVNRRVEFRMIE